ncbi:hypothetical protein Lal_00020545 [Lupinus albus]|nr:hypothetical protein Lal_00020545 [Lupinus albus]
MRGLQKSKRVTWASALNLCQMPGFVFDHQNQLTKLSLSTKVRMLNARSQPLPTWEGQVMVIVSGGVLLVHSEASEGKLTKILDWPAY